MTKLTIVSSVLLTACLTVFYFSTRPEVEIAKPPLPTVHATLVKEDKPVVAAVSVPNVVAQNPAPLLEKKPDQLIEVRNGVITIIGEAEPKIEDDTAEITIDLTLPSRPQDDIWVAANMPIIASRNKNNTGTSTNKDIYYTKTTANAGTSVLKVTRASFDQSEDLAQATIDSPVASLAQDKAIVAPQQVASLAQDKAIVAPQQVASLAPVKAIVAPRQITSLAPDKAIVVSSTVATFANSQVPSVIKVNTTPVKGVPEQYGEVAPSFPPLPPNTIIKTNGVTSTQETILEETTPNEPLAPVAKNKTAPKKNTYDQNGNYIESDVKIDYGQWGEGYKSEGTAKTAARTQNDAEYLKWRNAQMYWDNAQQNF